ncbi:hypothetical protein DL93DRAFT_579516 [Clavulina sp. PMI_390]|nr:hypothetical protein DL93DRAFT_579516 [Clavulina sp. PMI_390]
MADNLRHEPSEDDIARFRGKARRCRSLRYGGSEQKALLVIIALEHFLPSGDFFPNLQEIIIEHPGRPYSLQDDHCCEGLSAPFPFIHKVKTIIFHHDNTVRPWPYGWRFHSDWDDLRPHLEQLHQLSFTSTPLNTLEDHWSHQPGNGKTNQTSQWTNLEELMNRSVAQTTMDRSALFQHLPQHYPKTVFVKKYFMMFPLGFLNLIKATSYTLRTLTLPSVPDMNTWVTLNSVPLLESLTLGQIGGGGHLFEDWRPDQWLEPSSLAGMAIIPITLHRLDSLTVCARLINVAYRVRFPNLTRLVIDNPAEELGVENIPFVLEHIGEHMPKLQHLSVDMGNPRIHDGDYTTPYPIFRTPEDMYTLLSRVPLLEYFHIGCSPKTFVPALKNPDIPIITLSIPNLSHFYLDPLRSPFSKITLDALISFPRSIPKLVTLGIGLDLEMAHFVNASAKYMVELQAVSPSKVKSLNVGAPWVQDSGASAEFLRTIFPDLRQVTLPNEKQYEVESVSERCFAWNKVVQYVEDSGKGAKSVEILAGMTRKLSVGQIADSDDDADYYYDSGADEDEDVEEYYEDE